MVCFESFPFPSSSERGYKVGPTVPLTPPTPQIQAWYRPLPCGEKGDWLARWGRWGYTGKDGKVEGGGGGVVVVVGVVGVVGGTY